MLSLLRPLLVLFALLSAITGVLYPVVVAGIGRAAFPHQTAGSLIVVDGHIAGSTLIGQSFQSPRYFWGRLSATAPMPDNPLASGGSNFGPTNPALFAAAEMRVAALRQADPGNQAKIPVDLVTASGSGIDPEISPAAALYQVPRVARERGLDPKALRETVLRAVEPPQWQVFGEPRVNVLLLNMQLDRAQ